LRLRLDFGLILFGAWLGFVQIFCGVLFLQVSFFELVRFQF
jgi:hypothetical protein